MDSVQTQRKCGFAISVQYSSTVFVLLIALLRAEKIFSSVEEILGGLL